mgnify:CR=1 FL=1
MIWYGKAFSYKSLISKSFMTLYSLAIILWPLVLITLVDGSYITLYRIFQLPLFRQRERFPSFYTSFVNPYPLDIVRGPSFTMTRSIIFYHSIILLSSIIVFSPSLGIILSTCLTGSGKKTSTILSIFADHVCRLWV